MKKIIKLSESDLSRMVKRIVEQSMEDRVGEFYSQINELIDMEYSDLEKEEVIEVLENILQNQKSQSHRRKQGRGSFTKDDVMKNWNMND